MKILKILTMHKFPFIIVLFIVFQSCYSYKAVNSPLEVGKYYKLQNAQKSESLRLKEITDSTYVFRNYKNEAIEISKKDFQNGTVRKFSILKSVLFSGVVFTGGLLYVYLVFS